MKIQDFIVYLHINKINPNFRVLYTGDGADELFFGYPRQKFVPYLKYFYKSYSKLNNIIDLKNSFTYFDNEIEFIN